MGITQQKISVNNNKIIQEGKECWNDTNIIYPLFSNSEESSISGFIITSSDLIGFTSKSPFESLFSILILYP